MSGTESVSDSSLFSLTTGSIKWRYLRKESNSDVYKVEWEYKPKGGSPTHKVDELSFDGVSPAKLVVNEQWVISIEPDQPPVKAK